MQTKMILTYMNQLSAIPNDAQPMTHWIETMKTRLPLVRGSMMHLLVLFHLAILTFLTSSRGRLQDFKPSKMANPFCLDSSSRINL